MGENTGLCDSYCELCGVCTSGYGHDGLHDSGYCQWDDEHALSPEDADAVYLANRNPLLSPLDDLIIAARKIEEAIEHG